MNKEYCHTCGQSLPNQTDRIAGEAEAIRAWCNSYGAPVVLGDYLKLQDAARYLGRSEKTLQNWIYGMDSPFAVRRVRKRAYLNIAELAEFVIREK